MNPIQLFVRLRTCLGCQRFVSITLTSIFFASFVLDAQYQPVSKYITQPETAREFVVDVANFYRNAKDERGGYFTFLNQDGNPALNQSPWPGYERKSLCSISRVAYAFNRAFMLTGDVTFLMDARHALSFLYDKGWDTSNDGWYFTYNLDADISFGPYWEPDQKWTFQQEYALIGIVSMVEVTGGNVNWNDNGTQLTDFEWLERGVSSLDRHVWDNRLGYFGFFESAKIDWTSKTGKGFTGTIDGLNTFSSLNALMYPENEDHVNRFRFLSDIARDRLVGSMNANNIVVGFPESFDSNWNVNYGSSSTGIGHIIKTAWCLGRAAIYFDDDSYATSAQKLLNQVMEKNNPKHDNLYDHVYGGPFSKVNIQSGKIESTAKNHWVLEQGFTGGIINYYITNDSDEKDAYLRMADESVDFFENNLVDKVYGASWTEASTDGGYIINSSKGDDFKAGFHDAELGYYAYMYSSIYYHNTPIDLFYYFEIQNNSRQVQLNPLCIKDELLYISKVELDGNEYFNFDANQRKLSIDAGLGGVFKVEFTPREKSFGTSLLAFKENNLKVSVFPNPFHHQLNISFDLLRSADVIVSIHDMGGRLVDDINHGFFVPGRHELVWRPKQTGNLNSGVYLLTLSTGLEKVTKKIVLVQSWNY